jgi:hypothetical protein
MIENLTMLAGFVVLLFVAGGVSALGLLIWAEVRLRLSELRIRREARRAQSANWYSP